METARSSRLKDHVRANWRTVALICRKCSKKLGGGFGPKGDERLARALRRHLSLKTGRKAAAGIVEVNCLGVCPKGAVTVVDGADSREWLLVRPGADLDALAQALGMGANHP
ncbi:(2Fe-2S) ferredoxin domain-containing protein [Sphingobium sp. HBC34]|uniref:(2Fe-2S) ferredoxin domain-containing protein n=1 Tax=Sphingobium cyanobacteriorum TaxID=3063954 RepID=A0ABT8ZRF0_9SPHN|nr:(2Fe-2S) ferredoxin domain-containing protein [Sphingobium sp. HBC34]MDO7836051.1 (2Fe-2S) ferredoxin domain-containing protein [Sphingobium sp. HBC34]